MYYSLATRVFWGSLAWFSTLTKYSELSFPPNNVGYPFQLTLFTISRKMQYIIKLYKNSLLSYYCLFLGIKRVDLLFQFCSLYTFVLFLGCSGICLDFVSKCELLCSLYVYPPWVWSQEHTSKFPHCVKVFSFSFGALCMYCFNKNIILKYSSEMLTTVPKCHMLVQSSLWS